MLNKFLLLALSVLLIPATVHGLTEPDRQELQIKNILAPYNPGFENGKAKWTASGGSFTVTTTASDVAFGRSAAVFDASASSQNLDSTSVTIPSGLYGKPGLAVCRFKTSATDYKLQVHDGTNVVAEGTIPASSTYSSTSVPFPFPSSGSLKLRITSQSNATSVDIDNCYLGEDYSIGQSSQATLYGAIFVPGTSNCQWTGSTSTTFANFSADTDCPTYTVIGNATAPATKIPGMTFATLPPGYYKIVVMGSLAKISNAGTYVNFRVSDGTNHSNKVMVETLAGSVVNSTGAEFFLNYTTAQNSVTLQMQSAGDGSATPGIYYDGGLSVSDFAMYVYRYPTAPEQAYRPSQTPASWSGAFSTDCGWLTSSTTAGGSEYSDDGSCTFTERTNRNFGTVSAYSSKKPGITFTPPKIGRYKVCASFDGFTTNTGSPASYYLVHGSTELDSGSIETNVRQHMTLCGIADVISVASQTIQVKGAISNSSYNNHINGAANTALTFTITDEDSGNSAPYLIGSITSNSSGQERIERAKLVISTNTVSTQSGSWISSISQGTTGVTNVTIASGIFSAEPTCTCSSNGVSADACAVICSSATSCVTRTWSGGTLSNEDNVKLICMGPR